MAIILHQRGWQIFVNLSAIAAIFERRDGTNKTGIFLIGSDDILVVDESFDDIMTLIEAEKHG